MKALISPNEVRYDYLGNAGIRVADVSVNGFEVAPPLYWIDCPDNCVPDLWWIYQNNLEEIPQPPIEPELPQPISQGTQTL